MQDDLLLSLGSHTLLFVQVILVVVHLKLFVIHETMFGLKMLMPILSDKFDVQMFLRLLRETVLLFGLVELLTRFD